MTLFHRLESARKRAAYRREDKGSDRDYDFGPAATADSASSNPPADSPLYEADEPPARPPELPDEPSVNYGFKRNRLTH